MSVLWYVINTGDDLWFTMKSLNIKHCILLHYHLKSNHEKHSLRESGGPRLQAPQVDGPMTSSFKSTKAKSGTFAVDVLKHLKLFLEEPNKVVWWLIQYIIIVFLVTLKRESCSPFKINRSRRIHVQSYVKTFSTIELNPHKVVWPQEGMHQRGWEHPQHWAAEGHIRHNIYVISDILLSSTYTWHWLDVDMITWGQWVSCWVDAFNFYGNIPLFPWSAMSSVCICVCTCVCEGIDVFKTCYGCLVCLWFICIEFCLNILS